MDLNHPYLLSALAAAPGLAICIYIYWKDKFDPEPRSLLVKSFFLGIGSVIMTLLISELILPPFGFEHESTNLVWSLASCVLGIGLVEEYSKYFFVRYFAYRKPAFNEPFDGITYCVIVSMGFATLENFAYVFQNEDGFKVAILRMFLSVPAHAVFGVIMGYHLGLQKHYGRKHAGAYGLMLAAVLHGLFDFFLFQSYIPGMFLGALASLFFGLRYSLRAIKMHSEISPFNGKNVVTHDSEQDAVG
ncbi:MAG: PrsW family intramembrane metalloprotease [Bacteroidota bacterium]